MCSLQQGQQCRFAKPGLLRQAIGLRGSISQESGKIQLYKCQKGLGVNKPRRDVVQLCCAAVGDDSGNGVARGPALKAGTRDQPVTVLVPAYPQVGLWSGSVEPNGVAA